MSEPLLSVKNLKTYFYTEEGVMPSVDGIDFDLAAGETLAIVGESGCGKSVTSLSIMRLVQTPPGKIVDGEILYNGEDLLKKSQKEMPVSYTHLDVYKRQNLDSQAPNRAAGEFLRAGGLFDSPQLVRPETKWGNSRFDFYVEAAGRKIFLEVKGVTLERDGLALFPDAPTQRGVKHLSLIHI